MAIHHLRGVMAVVVSAVVVMSASPANARVGVGVGTIAGMIDYGSSEPPPPLALCSPVNFDIEATSLTASVGTFSVTGSGSGFCESALLGGGSVSLSIGFVAVDGT